ncbi:MAG: transposase [Firmicutes bacterium]|nr:transposase [Bacillota bacterium]
MGVIDTESKLYFSKNSIFADMFNFKLYNGKNIIKADELRELDTTEISVPYGNGARVPLQKHRDVLKIWSAMTDGKAVYVILGSEVQDKIHYAMPIKNGLYDMLGYASQVNESRKSYKKKLDITDLSIDDGTVRIKLTSAEFLSGFRKEDRLIPIITLTIYLSPEEWDGPLDLHSMLDIEDKELLEFVPNYRVNLIAPMSINDDDFEKFHTDLGLAMKVLKYQNDGVVDVIQATNHKKIDRDTAVFLNAVTNLGLEFEEKEAAIDMCKAMEDYTKKTEIIGAIKGMKLMGASESDILTQIIKNFNVTKDYVVSLLKPQGA